MESNINIHKGTKIIVKDIYNGKTNYLVVQRAEINIYQLVVLNNSRLLPMEFSNGEAIKNWLIDNFKREDFIIIND